MRWLWLVVACGCNQIFGIQITRTHDDAPPLDAAPTCPGFGGAPPEFSILVHQYIARNCDNYTVSTTAQLAAAYCYDNSQIVLGAVDGELQPTGITSTVPSAYVTQPRLSPDGDELWIRQIDSLSFTQTFSIYREVGTSWELSQTLPLDANLIYQDAITAPTRRGDSARHFLYLSVMDYSFHEYVEQASSWQEQAVYSPAIAGLGTMTAPALSSDGLHVVFRGQPIGVDRDGMYYADRPTIDDLFGPARQMPTAPVATDGYLTDDCARLYLSGLGSVFYAQHQ